MHPTDPKAYQVQVAWESFFRNVWKEQQGPEDGYIVFQRTLMLVFTDGVPEYTWPNLALWLARKLVPIVQGNNLLAQPPVFFSIIDDRYARFHQEAELFDLISGSETRPIEGVKHKVYNLTALARHLKDATDALKSLKSGTEQFGRSKIERSEKTEPSANSGETSGTS